MADQTSTINARIPATTRDALEKIARERRMKTGDAVGLADLVREALAAYLEGGDTGQPENKDEAFGSQVLDALEQLAEEARRLGLEDSQDFGMEIWKEVDGDPRLEELRPFVNRLNEALKAST